MLISPNPPVASQCKAVPILTLRESLKCRDKKQTKAPHLPTTQSPRRSKRAKAPKRFNGRTTRRRQRRPRASPIRRKLLGEERPESRSTSKNPPKPMSPPSTLQHQPSTESTPTTVLRSKGRSKEARTVHPIHQNPNLQERPPVNTSLQSWRRSRRAPLKSETSLKNPATIQLTILSQHTDRGRCWQVSKPWNRNQSKRIKKLNNFNKKSAKVTRAFKWTVLMSRLNRWWRSRKKKRLISSPRNSQN